MGNIFAIVVGVFAGFIAAVGNGNPIVVVLSSLMIGGMCWVAFGSFGDGEKL